MVVFCQPISKKLIIKIDRRQLIVSWDRTCQLQILMIVTASCHIIRNFYPPFFSTKELDLVRIVSLSIPVVMERLRLAPGIIDRQVAS